MNKRSLATVPGNIAEDEAVKKAPMRQAQFAFTHLSQERQQFLAGSARRKLCVTAFAKQASHAYLHKFSKKPSH
ncbi:hypothetical protein ACKVEX_14550 [Rhodocyclaceae bacterium SMB388]